MKRFKIAIVLITTFVVMWPFLWGCSTLDSRGQIFAYHGGVKWDGGGTFAAVIFSEKLLDSDELYFYHLIEVSSSSKDSPRQITAIGPKCFANSKYVRVENAKIYLRDGIQDCALVIREVPEQETTAMLERPEHGF